MRSLSFASGLLLVLATVLAAVPGCASGAASGGADSSGRPRYKPGQSLEARLCECRECFDVNCCDGDNERDETASDGGTELGIAVTACSRCVRRTWTVRGREACSSLAPRECCAGSTKG